MDDAPFSSSGNPRKALRLLGPAQTTVGLLGYRLGRGTENRDLFPHP